MDEKTVEEAIKLLRESKQRKFSQTLDVIVTLKNIDLKKPENKFSKDISLPHGRGKETRVGIISASSGVGKAEIEAMEKDKKKAQEFTKKYDSFLCEPPLMPLVGKVLGKYLAPKGKMPKLLPPGRNAEDVIKESKNSIRIKVRDSPMVQVSAGIDSMTDEQLGENSKKVLEEISSSLPGKVQIRNAYLKFTMSKPIKVKV